MAMKIVDRGVYWTGSLIPLLVICVELVISAHSQQTLNSLSVLTASAAALPKGCALEPPAPITSPVPSGGATVIDVVTGAGFPSNPWSGKDLKLVAAVRKAIDGAPTPEGPVSAELETRALELTLAANVLEAYRASYMSAEGARLEVYAITLTDPKLTRAEAPSGSNRPETLSARLVRGATIVKLVSLTHPPNSCFDAVGTHIGLLK
jgi:hypothetical protein